MSIIPARVSVSGLRLPRCMGRLAAVFLAAGLLGAGTTARAADAYWTSGTTQGAWSNAANWTTGSSSIVPDSTTNAFTTATGADIILGANAQAKTFFVEGPIGGESQLSSGTLTLSDQLWINISSGTNESTAVPLRLYDGGSAPVSVTANNASLGVDAGTQGAVILDSLAGGNVTFAVTNTLTIGNDGSGSYVSSSPYLAGGAAGTVAITANTIQTSVNATAGADYYNYIGTYNTGHSVTATNLVLGVSGSQGAADNYGGVWNITNTSLADQASSGGNYLTIADGGTFTNSGAFTVGVRGSNNNVYVGINDGFATIYNGTLNVTGSNDLVIGSGSTADTNRVTVDLGSTLSVAKNIVVGVDGHTNSMVVDNASTVTSAGARLGANAGSTGNTVTVTGSSAWTMDGNTVRVGDKGSNNAFFIASGATVTLTGSGKNFYVGYDKSASDNALSISGTGAKLTISGSNADLVVSGNVTGTGANATGNLLIVEYGGVVDAVRTLVGNGGQIRGDAGTINGNTLVGTGGSISPGHYGPTGLGALSFTGNVDLSNGGTLEMTIGSGTGADFIDVGGTLVLSGSSTSTLALDGATADPGTAYIIAHYGSLSGVFGSITGLPAGATIDYNYLGLNEIAIITAVPEIATASAGGAFALLACSLAMLERRSLKRRSMKRRRHAG